ncbi:MAG: ThiF family adenylyltransferase, partial [Chloroflexi bacterium]|nr:ThiF family adenylyltransferase [Chloroflexota bacterium]
MLTKQEQERYGRQLIIPEWGSQGQEKIKNAKVLVAGAGGLGSAILTYLSIAGIGKIRIIDNDQVELSNLNRQMLHTHMDIGRDKVDSARERLEQLNPDIHIEV